MRELEEGGDGERESERDSHFRFMSGLSKRNDNVPDAFAMWPSVCQPVKGWAEGEMSPIERLGPGVDFGPSDFRPRTVERRLYIQHSLE